MVEKRPRNSGPKRRTRQYAVEHGLTYAQAFQQLHPTDFTATLRLEEVRVPIGAEVELHSDRGRGTGTGYRIGAEHLWAPFEDGTSSCAFIGPHDELGFGSICHQIAENGLVPVDSVLAVTSHELIDCEETQWLSDGSWNFQQLVMNNRWAGYSQASKAAEAIAKFRPRPGRIGIVILQFSDPYERPSEEDIEAGRELYSSEEKWKEWAAAQRDIAGPFWEETIYTDHPDGRTTARYVNHSLSQEEQEDYARFLLQVDRLLQRAAQGGIIVLVSADYEGDAGRLLDRMGLERFGARFFNAVRFEYSNKPEVNSLELFSSLFPFVESPPDLPAADDRYFWAGGMEPKQGRVAYASFAGLTTRPTLLLLKDPPEVASYWLNTYESMSENWGWD